MCKFYLLKTAKVAQWVFEILKFHKEVLDWRDEYKWKNILKIFQSFCLQISLKFMNISLKIYIPEIFCSWNLNTKQIKAC